jgi:pimeloyl-ACP methyl ester carboxylesterase
MMIWPCPLQANLAKIQPANIHLRYKTMKTTSPKEIQIKLPHLTIAAKQWGNPNGQPVLALHGWLDNAATFDALAPLLPDYNLIAIDFPGHGLSDHRPLGVVYHIIDFTAEIFDIANALSWDTFSIIGHSMGAALGGLAASAIPERINKLVLFDFLGTLPCRISESAQQLGRHIKELERRRVSSMPLYDSIEQMIEARIRTGNIFRGVAEAIIERSAKSIDDHYTWRSDSRLTVTASVLMSEEQNYSFLEAMKCPTLLFMSNVTFPHYQQLFEQRIKHVPNMETCLVDSNHYLHFEKAEEIAEKIKAFFVAHDGK